MKNNLKKDSKFDMFLVAIISVAAIYMLYLIFVFLPLNKAVITKSQIPALNTGQVERLDKEFKDRTDINTDSKPDTKKFTIGNPEPFK